jgi:hypothetical protein
MKRGNYKQYSSTDKMPKSTRYDLAKKLKVQESEVLINISKENCFVSLFNSSHLFSKESINTDK